MDAHIVPAIGMIKLRDLKAHHIQELIGNKANKGLTRGLQFIKLALTQMLDQAVKNDFIYKNVARDVVLPPVDHKKRRPLMNVEQSYINNSNIPLKAKAFLSVLLYTGLRRGEAHALQKTDIDLKKKTLTINKNLIFLTNGIELKDCPKTQSGFRTIPMPDLLVEILTKYLVKLDSDFVFPSAVGKPMTRSAFVYFWNSAIKSIKSQAMAAKEDMKTFLVDISPHSLRHTYATTLYYAGVDIKTAQYFLGHANIGMTLDLYTHLQHENDTTAIQRLNEHLLPKKTLQVVG